MFVIHGADLFEELYLWVAEPDGKKAEMKESGMLVGVPVGVLMAHLLYQLVDAKDQSKAKWVGMLMEAHETSAVAELEEERSIPSFEDVRTTRLKDQWKCHLLELGHLIFEVEVASRLDKKMPGEPRT
jgi:hypothetical protein